MKVKELIAVLKTLDPKADVEIANACIVTDYTDPLGFRWANGGTRELYENDITETKSKYSDRKIVVLG